MRKYIFNQPELFRKSTWTTVSFCMSPWQVFLWNAPFAFLRLSSLTAKKRIQSKFRYNMAPTRPRLVANIWKHIHVDSHFHAFLRSFSASAVQRALLHYGVRNLMNGLGLWLTMSSCMRAVPCACLRASYDRLRRCRRVSVRLSFVVCSCSGWRSMLDCAAFFSGVIRYKLLAWGIIARHCTSWWPVYGWSWMVLVMWVGGTGVCLM